MNPQNKIQVFPTPEALAEGAAECIIADAKKAIEARGRFVVSLSGGHTPERMFALLAQPSFQGKIPWEKTFLFWGDERCVPADDPQNNARMTRQLLLNKIVIPAENIFPIPVNDEPAAGAAAYENTIRRFFENKVPRFDLVLLGLGENGHTASLFPGTEVVHEEDHLVKEVYVAEQKMYRITMTAPLINAARHIVFLMEGTSKADVLKTILTAPYQPDVYPAQLIEPADGVLDFLVDKDAASKLPQEMLAVQ